MTQEEVTNRAFIVVNLSYSFITFKFVCLMVKMVTKYMETVVIVMYYINVMTCLISFRFAGISEHGHFMSYC